MSYNSLGLYSQHSNKVEGGYVICLAMRLTANWHVKKAIGSVHKISQIHLSCKDFFWLQPFTLS